MEETFSNMVIQRMKANCRLGMLKFDKNVVKLDLIIFLHNIIILCNIIKNFG